MISAHSCSVLIADLITSPYHLPWGSSVYAKVTATNIINDSLQSDEGNGAVILTNPDAPRDLTNIPSITMATQVGLSWSEGLENGGSSVIDYTLEYGV